MIAIEAGRRDLIPGQRIIECAFADLVGIEERRVGNVRDHPSMLRTISRDSVKLALGNLQLALLKGHQRLNGSFTKGLLSDHDTAAVILNGTGKNF
ncbi:MAG: Uncharacterised protein [Halieaceae bacterium]|nr:MAG: Uncharacterised protein [Halieaceae bacterium]